MTISSRFLRSRTAMTPGLVAAAASDALEPVLAAPGVPATVQAVFDHAIYLSHEGGVLALVTSDGIHHPNGVALARAASHRPFAGIQPGDPARVGDRRVRVGHDRVGNRAVGDGRAPADDGHLAADDGHPPTGCLEVQVTRWWRARPTLRPTRPRTVADALRVARLHLAASAAPLPYDLREPLDAFVAALTDADRPRAGAAADHLIGLGPGLTPSGDDLIAGVLSGAQLLAPVVGGAGSDALVGTVRDVGAAVAARARQATTAISAALLQHAARGEVAAPAADLLRALTGHGRIPAAVDGLLAVGSSSGRDLAAGLLTGADLAVSATVTAVPWSH